MNKINRVELLGSKKTRVARLKEDAFQLVEEKCKAENININIYISNAILEKLERDGVIELV